MKKIILIILAFFSLNSWGQSIYTDENQGSFTFSLGSSITITDQTPITLTPSISSQCTEFLWTTTGTGTFADSTAKNTTYTPSVSDLSLDSITLNLISTCNIGDSSIIYSHKLILVDNNYEFEVNKYLSELNSSISDDYTDNINTLVVMLKDSLSVDSLSEAFDFLYKFSSENKETGLKDLIYCRDADTVNTLLFEQFAGFTGNGINSYINTNWNGRVDSGAYRLNNASFGVYFNSTTNGTAYEIEGGRSTTADGGSNNQTMMLRNNGYSLTTGGRINSATITSGTHTSANGLYTVTRPAADTQRYYYNSTLIAGNTAASTKIPNQTLFILANHLETSLSSNYENDQVSYAFAGKSFTDIQLRKIKNCFEYSLSESGTLMNPKNDLLRLNDHYDEAFANEVELALDSLFAYDYIMPDGSPNFYDRYIVNSNIADFFFVLKAKDNIAAKNLYLSPDVLDTVQTYVLSDNAVYRNKTGIAAHTLLSDSSLVIVSFDDGLEDMSIFNIHTDSFAGIIPNLDYATNNKWVYTYNNHFTKIPDISNNNLLRYTIYNNDITGNIKLSSTALENYLIYSNEIDSIISPELFISTNLASINISDNNLKSYSIDNFLDKMSRYFAINNPIKNLSFTYNANISGSTCGNSNPDILRLKEEFTDAGYTFTAGTAQTTTAVVSNPTSMVMPDTIYILTGDTTYIYDDNICGQKINQRGIDVKYTCDIGDETYYGYMFTGALADTGFYNFKAVAYTCNSTKIDSVSAIVALIKRDNGSGEYSFNLIGNSLTAMLTFTPTLFDSLDAITATSYGTQTTGAINHQGMSGYQLADFASATGRYPIITDGYSHYREDTLSVLNPFDFVIIQLGVNDFLASGTDTTYCKNILYPMFDAMVDSILNDGTKYLILCLPPKGNNSGLIWSSETLANQFQLNMNHYWNYIVNKYGGKRYANNIFISYQGMVVDRDNDFPKIGLYHNDTVHPNTTGRVKMANALRATIEGILKYNE